MIKINIFEKIFEIMEEYEKLIHIKKNNKINKENNSSNLNNFFEKDFFEFIYNNIKINKEINIENINKNDNDNIENINKKDNDNNENIDKNYNYNSFQDITNNSLIIINRDINKDINEDINNDINKDINNNYSIIQKYIKKIYKKIVLMCHPDKNGDKELFIKCQEYYNNNFLIGILYIGYKIKINFPELNKTIIDYIFGEIRIIQEKIKNNQI